MSLAPGTGGGFRGYRRAWAALAIAASSLSASVPASAFVRTTVVGDSNVCLYWVTRSHGWWLYQNPAAPSAVAGLAWDGVEAALQRSVQTWADQECSDVVFSFEGPTPQYEIGYDPSSSENKNLLVFRESDCTDVVNAGDPCLSNDSCGDTYNCWDHTDAIIALTTVSYDQTTGEISDADIEFNATTDSNGLPNFRFTDGDGPPCGGAAGESMTDCVATDIQNTATHETGHFLGLAHTPDASATMYAIAPAGQTSKRQLSADDVDGLCSIYPRGGPTSWCVPPASKAQGCSTAGGTGLGGLIIVAGVLRPRSRRGRNLAAT